MALAAVAAILAWAPPAYAGNWAVTELDPLPSRMEPGVAYTVGYWVLQHGTHPFDGTAAELGTTGLRIVGENDKGVTFAGTRLPEPAHYAVTIILPPGVWRLQGVQGVFGTCELGLLTVPGGLRPVPPEFPAAPGGEVKDYWGDAKPPGFPWSSTPVAAAPATPAATTAAPVPATPAPATSAKASSASGGVPYPLAAVLVLAAGAAALLTRRGAGRRAEDDAAEPDGPAQDVITIGRGS
ncbi:hypothetical protein GCM10009530_47220 [Microbispora corallina]|uniref:Uncharacterized protein n=1 Tax=Microbispora corallina TaxID=83302 RepID=A0ABQ4G5D9_9ACTN|nr:hypothetical protein Mco01_52970 [Microbispora corallina]